MHCATEYVFPSTLPFLFASEDSPMQRGEVDGKIQFSNMMPTSGLVLTRATKRLEDYVAFRLSEVDSVNAVLAAEISGVLNVWVLINEWTAQERRKVYAQQRLLIGQFADSLFDFYVLPTTPESDPTDMVSDMPVVWQRH